MGHIGLPKIDVDTYIEKITPHMRSLIEQQIKEMGSVKIQLCIWVKWKITEEMVIQLTPEEFEQAENIHGEVKEIIVEKAFNSKMTEIFQRLDIEEILEQMFTYIKTGIENPALPKSGFTMDSIMHLDISFHELQLIKGSSYIDPPAWVAAKKAVLNPKNEKDEECFKWAVIAALHSKEIDCRPEQVSKLEPYSDHYNWKGLDFPVAVSKIDIAVNVLYIHQRDEGKSNNKIPIFRILDNTWSKMVNLLLITDGEKRHYTWIKSLSRLLSRVNSVKRNQQYYCLNCLKAFNLQGLISTLITALITIL